MCIGLSPLTRFVHCLFQKKKPLNLSSTPSYVTHTFESHLNMDSFHVWRYLDERCMGGPISHLKVQTSQLFGRFPNVVEWLGEENFQVVCFFLWKRAEVEIWRKKRSVGVRWWRNTKDGVTFSTNPVGWGCFLLTFTGLDNSSSCFSGDNWLYPYQRIKSLYKPFIVGI